MWRTWKSYSPAIARKATISGFSASVIEILSMYGSWLPSVSTQMLYGFRSSTQLGVLIGWVVFHGERTGRSGFSIHEFLNRKRFAQLS